MDWALLPLLPMSDELSDKFAASSELRYAPRAECRRCSAVAIQLRMQ